MKYARGLSDRKSKYDSQGNFERIKARLVAGGHLQDKTDYEDLSSPTVALPSIMTIATLAAAERRHVWTADIGGAFLNAEMEAEVYMSLDPMITAIYCAVDPDAQSYINRSTGKLTVRLTKALYGCVESAMLFNKHITATLREIGFEPNDLDPCTLNKGTGIDQITIMIHVDDLMITSADAIGMQKVEDHLRNKYKEISVKKDADTLSYLGMTFNFDRLKGQVTVTMEKHVNDCVDILEQLQLSYLCKHAERKYYQLQSHCHLKLCFDLLKINEQ